MHLTSAVYNTYRIDSSRLARNSEVYQKARAKLSTRSHCKQHGLTTGQERVDTINGVIRQAKAWLQPLNVVDDLERDQHVKQTERRDFPSVSRHKEI